MPNLLVIASLPVSARSGGLSLDRKFVDGMLHFAKYWTGSVKCLILKDGDDVPFGKIALIRRAEDCAEHIPCFGSHIRRRSIDGFFAKLKQYRRIATRYDKLATNFLGFVKLANIMLWIK